jgi:hypothetical protein
VSTDSDWGGTYGRYQVVYPGRASSSLSSCVVTINGKAVQQSQWHNLLLLSATAVLAKSVCYMAELFCSCLVDCGCSCCINIRYSVMHLEVRFPVTRHIFPITNGMNGC